MIFVNVIINFIIGLALILFGKIMFGFEVTSFSLFFVVPVGSLVAGAIMCGGLSRGLFKKNIKSSGSLQLINVLMAMVFFVLIQFAYYQVTYLDDDMNINYKFQGEQVGNFVFEDDEPVNFINFTVDKIDSQVITFSRRTRAIGSVDGNTTVNWIFFAIDFIGYVIGGVFGYNMTFTDAVYCETCKKYMKKDEIFSILENIPEKENKLKALSESEAADELEIFIKENPIQKPKNKEPFYYKGTFYRCESCADGFILLEYHALNSKGKYDSDTDKDVKIKLSKEAVRQLSQNSK